MDAPVYLFDTKEQSKANSFISHIKTDGMEEEDLFQSPIPLSWDSPTDTILSQTTYGVFIRMLCSNYEKGLISADTFKPLFIFQMSYFLNGLVKYVFQDNWNKEEAKRIVKDIVSDMSSMNVETKNEIIQTILFKVEQTNVDVPDQEAGLSSVNERMKQIGSMYIIKSQSCPTIPPSCDACSCNSYARDVQNRYKEFHMSDLSNMYAEYDRLKDIKTIFSRVYSVSDPFATANIWQIVTNLFGVNDPNEISRVGEIAIREMGLTVPMTEDLMYLYEIPERRSELVYGKPTVADEPKDDAKSLETEPELELALDEDMELDEGEVSEEDADEMKDDAKPLETEPELELALDEDMELDEGEEDVADEPKDDAKPLETEPESEISLDEVMELDEGEVDEEGEEDDDAKPLETEPESEISLDEDMELDEGEVDVADEPKDDAKSLETEPESEIPLDEDMELDEGEEDEVGEEDVADKPKDDAKPLETEPESEIPLDEDMELDGDVVREEGEEEVGDEPKDDAKSLETEPDSYKIPTELKAEDKEQIDSVTKTDGDEPKDDAKSLETELKEDETKETEKELLPEYKKQPQIPQIQTLLQKKESNTLLDSFMKVTFEPLGFVPMSTIVSTVPSVPRDADVVRDRESELEKKRQETEEISKELTDEEKKAIETQRQEIMDKRKKAEDEWLESQKSQIEKGTIQNLPDADAAGEAGKGGIPADDVSEMFQLNTYQAIIEPTLEQGGGDDEDESEGRI